MPPLRTTQLTEQASPIHSFHKPKGEPESSGSKSGKMSKASISKSGKVTGDQLITVDEMEESFMVPLSAAAEEAWLSFSFGRVEGEFSLDYDFAMGEEDKAKDAMSL